MGWKGGEVRGEVDTGRENSAGREPWVPPSHAVRLQPGAKARVRLSGECKLELIPGCWYWQLGYRSYHPPFEDGLIVTIEQVYPSKDGHDYVVKTEPIDIGDGYRTRQTIFFAASELEPLEEVGWRPP